MMLPKFTYFFIFIFIAIALKTSVYAQCDSELREAASKNKGTNALIINEFSIDNFKSRNSFFPKSKRYFIQLENGFVYRFNLENAINYEGKVVMQLFDSGLLLATTFNLKTENHEKLFDFICTENKEYELVLSFVDNKKGCALALMSILLNDSTQIEKIFDKAKNTSKLYVGIDNYLNIAATEIPDGKIEVRCDSINLKQENGSFIIKPQKTGLLKLDIIAFDEQGNVSETLQIVFDVVEQLPLITFCNISGGLISRTDLNLNPLKLTLLNYKEDTKFSIKKFTIVKNFHETGTIQENTDLLNNRQISILRNLKNGDTFYIKDIIIENQNGDKYKLENLFFTISE